MESIANFHPIKAARLVAGLLVCSKYHANTLRIEKLIHAILANASGSQRPSPGKISSWLNKSSSISSSRFMEDPVEDVFITHIMTDQGDFRIYEGTWEANDFHLQKVLDTIKSIPPHFDLPSLFRPIYSLLNISEKVAARNKEQLYQIADSRDKIDIQVPGNEVLKSLAKSLSFTEADIKEMGYDLEDLKPFIFDPAFWSSLNNQRLGNTDLERRPLVYGQNRVILILPTAVSVAIRRFIFEWLSNNGLIRGFEKNFVGECINFLQETPILGKPTPSHVPLVPKKVSEAYFIEVCTKIDKGRYLQIIAIIDTLHGLYDGGMDSPVPHAQDQMDEIESRIHAAGASLQREEGFREGLTLIVSWGYGRPYVAGFSEIPDNWDVQFIPAHDLETIGWIPGASDMSLWRLFDQQRQLKNYGFQFSNLSSVLNLYGLWEQNNHVLIPDQLEIGNGPSTLYIATDYLALVRQKTRKASHLHTEKYIDGHYKRVRRKHLSSLFDEEQNESLYASYGDICKGDALGCAVSKTRPWWIGFKQDEGKPDSSIQFKIWDSLHNWMQRISIVLDKKYPKLGLGPVLFSLDLSQLPAYTHFPKMPPPTSEKLIDVEISKTNNTVILRVKEPFLYQIHNPVNISEKELVRSAVSGFLDLSDVKFSEEELSTLCQSIVPNNDARYIHIFEAYRFRDVIRDYGECKFTKIEDFDDSFLKIGLGHIDGASGAREIKGKDECVSFLNAVVDYTWEQLKGELKKYNRQSLIMSAFRNIEGIALEKSQWDSSARALLGLREDEQDVHKARMEQFSLFYGADLASRLLVETAICECPLGEGYEVGSLDLSPLMVRALLLHHMGSLSDAIEKGVTEPRIIIAGNGEIKSNHSFEDTVIQPFANQFELSRLRSSAKKYDENFEGVPPTLAPADVIEENFLIAFEKEMGLGVEALRNLCEIMEKMAIEKRKTVFSACQSEITEYCRKSEISSEEEALKALRVFSLKPRGNWASPPEGYTGRDIYPWLFRRRLSLLLKPYVKMNEDEDPLYIISPGISSDALIYTLRIYLDGNIEAERCHSSEMKKWIGNETNRRGHNFNKTVAKELETLGYKAKADVDISSIVSKQDLDKNYGDIDVLAWSTDEAKIYLIECKDLYYAKTTKEIAEQLTEFKGEDRNGEPDRLKKHVQRYDLLSKKPEELSRYCDLQGTEIEIMPYIVFSNPAPVLYDQSRAVDHIKLTHIQHIMEKGYL